MFASCVLMQLDNFSSIVFLACRIWITPLECLEALWVHANNMYHLASWRFGFKSQFSCVSWMLSFMTYLTHPFTKFLSWILVGFGLDNCDAEHFGHIIPTSIHLLNGLI